MKKLISIMLTVAMVLSMLVAAIPASAASTVESGHVPADFDGDGVTDAGAKAVGSVAEFKAMADGGKYYLTKNLVIKTGSDGVAAGKPVKGWTGNGIYFDGCGYTIEFDKTAGTNATATSLFDGSNSANGLQIKNLNITGVINAPANHNQHVSALSQAGGACVIENVTSSVAITVSSLSDNTAVGGVWSKTEGSATTFKNVHFTGSITMKCAVPTAGYGGVGGIVGYVKGPTTIQDCSNSGNITVGVAGMTVPTGEANYGVGGIVGKVDTVSGGKTAKIVRSSNSGNLEIIELNNAYVGGMVGYSYKSDIYVDMCENSGAIKGHNNATTANSGNIHSGLGGILGGAYNPGSTCKIEIYGCSNNATGKITIADGKMQNIYAGGIVGRLYAVADVKIIGCTNAADIDVSNSITWASAGGIVGTYMTVSNHGWSVTSASNLVINKCQNSGKMTSGVWAAGIIASGVQLLQDEITVDISYCFNTASGEIKAGMDSTQDSADRAVAGGIVAMMGWETYSGHEQFGNLKLQYCANKAPVTAGTKALAAGGILGYMNGDSLVGTIDAGTETTETEQTSYAGQTFNAYAQRTWFDQCGNSGAITCQNANGKVATIAGVVANKYYLWNSQACGSRTLGSATPSTNAWVVNGWVLQAGNDMNTDKMDTLSSNTTNPIAASVALSAAIKRVELLGVNAQAELNAGYNARLTNDSTAMANATNALNVITRVDLTKLEAIIAEATGLSQSDYTADSWEMLQIVLADARAALNANSQKNIDMAEACLADAIAFLVGINEVNPYPPADDDNNDNNDEGNDDGSELDYSALESIIAEADALSENDYTAESWEAVFEALAVAIDTLDSQDQTEIDAATVALSDAIEALEALENVVEDDGAPNDNGNTNDNVTNDAEDDDEPSDDDDDDDDDDDKKKVEGGCGAAIATSAIVLATVTVLGLGLKKKED